MAISSLGSGSGIDLNGLLTSIMQAEQQPMLALQRQEASYQSRISALGSLQGALSSLQTAAASLVPTIGTTAVAKYASFSASVADTSIASASASAGAVAGTYSLEVSSLAQSQRLVSPGYTGASSAIPTGELTIEFGSLSGSTFTLDSARTKTITIDDSNKTLGGLRDAINAANVGASATIVTGTNGAQLVLTSNGTGLANVMRLSGLTGFAYNPATASGDMTQSASQGGQAAKNAAFTLNGIAATSSTNSVSGVLDGVTLSLTKETTTPTTLTVTKNTTGNLTTALNAFIKAYNDANKSMADLGAYNEKTKAAGALQGNSTLRTAQSQVRNMVFSTTTGGSSVYKSLSDIGVSVAKDGSLSLDTSKLNKAVAADFTSVANLVSSIGSTFKTGIEGLVGSTGSIASATEGANRSVKDLTRRQEALADRLTSIEARYRAQFTALDTLIANMKRTSSYLTQQLASLPGVSNSSSSS